MVVTWTTPSETSLSIVEFGTERLNNSVQGSVQSFTDGGSEHRKIWIHRVTLKDLLPDTRYCKYVHMWQIHDISNIRIYDTVINL